MTKKELSQLYYLNREVVMWQKELSRLQSKSIVGSPPLEGSGGGSDVSDKTADFATNLAYIMAIIEGKLAEIQVLRKRTMEYIASVDDSLLRQIMFLRCVSGFNWAEVAETVGGKNTEDSVKKLFYRHFNQK